MGWAQKASMRSEKTRILERYLVLVAPAETTIDQHDVHAACATLKGRPLRVVHGPHAQVQGGRI